MAIKKQTTMILRPDVDVKYHLREYDDCLMGNRKSYSSALMAKGQGPHLCAELLRLIFKYYMHWSHTDVRDRLNKEYIEALRIEPLVNRIPYPPEVNPKKEFYYVAWYLYPETVNVKPAELVIKLYMDIINNNLVKFPKGYFDGNIGYIRARLLFLTMVREFLPPFDCLERMYAFFASDKGRQCINAYKLAVPLRELYSSALDYMHDSLSDWQKDDDLYEKYSKIARVNEDDTHILVGPAAYLTPVEDAPVLIEEEQEDKQENAEESEPQEVEVVGLEGEDGE